MDALKRRLNGKRQTKESEISLDDLAALVKAGSVKKVVVCAGAGISSIPDFRSPKTGLYHNLQRFNLEEPEQIFDISFFRETPEPFFQLAHELYPGNFVPTITHTFIRLLHEKGILKRCFTQNIDTLERRAGIPTESIVEAHGSFAGNHCISKRCGMEADPEETKTTILAKGIPRCQKCKSLVKPDIVFFGEGLPEVFFDRLSDFGEADLLIVMGTSLQVQPFASLPDRVSRNCPRLLLNLEDVGDFSRPLDVVHLVECDAGSRQFAEACGWKDDLELLDEKIKSSHRHVALPENAENVVSTQERPKSNGGTWQDQTSTANTEDPSDGTAHNVETLVSKLKDTNL